VQLVRLVQLVQLMRLLVLLALLAKLHGQPVFIFQYNQRRSVNLIFPIAMSIKSFWPKSYGM
jgi:hypothetical protein